MKNSEMTLPKKEVCHLDLSGVEKRNNRDRER